MKRALAFALIALLAAPAQAIIGNTFIYSKTVLKIIPKPETEEVAGKAAPDDKKKEDNVVMTGNLLPKLKRAPKEFTVEVRQPSFLTQTDFIAHQPFTDREGMLIPIDPPAPAQVTATHMISSADVLFVNEDGIIIKIAPSLKLTGLTESIDSGKPIRAFVYLKAGMAQQSDIMVGDRIESDLFKTHPVVIQ